MNIEDKANIGKHIDAKYPYLTIDFFSLKHRCFFEIPNYSSYLSVSSTHNCNYRYTQLVVFFCVTYITIQYYTTKPFINIIIHFVILENHYRCNAMWIYDSLLFSGSLCSLIKNPSVIATAAVGTSYNIVISTATAEMCADLNDGRYRYFCWNRIPNKMLSPDLWVSGCTFV